MAINIYLPSRYIEVGNNVTFQNVDLVSPLTFNFGDGIVETHLQSLIVTHHYTTKGSKTVTVTSDNDTIFFEITVIEQQQYDPDMIRIFEAVPLQLPFGCPLVPPNEWIVADTINVVFNKFQANLDYLEKASKMYRHTPVEYLGWYGMADASDTPKWHSYNDSLSASFTTLDTSLSISTPNVSNFSFGINAMTASSDGLIWTVIDYPINSTSPYSVPTIVARKDTYTFAPIVLTNTKSIKDYFGKITALEFDTNNHLLLLDSKFNEVVVFKYIPGAAPKLEYLFKWGGNESYLENTTFINAIALHVDKQNNVYVIDSSNNSIRVFSITGIWRHTLTYDGMVPLDITSDIAGNLHVLTATQVYKFTKDFEFIETYDIRAKNSVPSKIVFGDPKGFIYITFNDKVYKFTHKGVFAGQITRNFIPQNKNLPFVATQQLNGILYVATPEKILKYADFIQILNTKKDTETLTWPTSAMQIDKEEFITDWVYNRCFARLWDNMEIFRRAIFNKFESYETEPGITALRTADFVVSDNLQFSNSKGDMIIGGNELVTADVINRVIAMFCENQSILVQLLTEKKEILPPIPFTFCWSWYDVRATGQNGITWEDTMKDSGLDFPITWAEAKSLCCNKSLEPFSLPAERRGFGFDAIPLNGEKLPINQSLGTTAFQETPLKTASTSSLEEKRGINYSNPIP